MARLKGPLFSVQATGRLAKALIYQRTIPGQNISRQQYYKVDKPTPAQLQIRSILAWTIQQWHALHTDKKEQWKSFIDYRGLKGYHSFIRLFLQQEYANEYHYELPPRHGYCIVGNHITNEFPAGGAHIPYTWQPVTEGLISWWQLDEGTGSVASDSVGPNNGTIYGPTWVGPWFINPWVPGESGTGIAEWTTDNKYIGNSSYRLFTGNGYARIKATVSGLKLQDIDGTRPFYALLESGQADADSPRIVISLDTNNDGVEDLHLYGACFYFRPNNNLSTWPGWKEFQMNDITWGTSDPGISWKTFDEIKSLLGTNKVVTLKFVNSVGATEKSVLIDNYILNGIILLNEPPFTTITGNTSHKFGNFLLFDGTDDYINFGNPTGLQVTGDKLTLEARIRLTSTPATWKMGPVKWGNSSYGSAGYYLGINAENKVNFGISKTGSDSYTTTSNTILTTDTWYHIVGVYDGTKLQVYINALPDGTPYSITGNIYNTPAIFTIGAYFPNGISGQFPGNIDEVRVYNRPLTQEEIEHNYHL